jgi:hypothetical protein
MHMSPRCRSLTLVLAAAVGVVDLAAQRGGASPEIQNRLGAYFVDVKLPPADTVGGKIALEATTLVEAAVKDKQLAFLYIYDPAQLPEKHPQFEQVIFGHAEINTGLRCFVCGRVNLAENPHAKAEFGNKTPLFIAFNEEGKQVGEVSIANYRAKASPIIGLQRKAHAGHGKMSLESFVIGYRKFLRDYQIYQGRKTVLEQKRTRLQQKSPVPAGKLRDVENEEKELEVDLEKMLVDEKQMLELANVPTRDPKAVLLPPRRGGGRQ